MSTKQDLENIKLRAQRACANLRVSMEGRGCPEEEVQKRCREVLDKAESRVQQILSEQGELS